MIPIKVGGLPLTTGPWDADRIDGWLDTPGMQVPSTARLGHGDTVGRARWSGRTIQIPGILRTRDCVQQQSERDRLAGMFHDGQSQMVEVTHGGVTVRGEFRLIDRLDFDPVTPEYAEWSLSLYSEDPFLYGGEQRVTVLGPGAGVGLVYPLFAPDGGLDYGAPSSATTGVLTNTGNADAWPMYRPHGDMPSGFRVWQDGHPIEWGGPVAPMLPVTVDTARSAVEIAGADHSHLLVLDDFQPVPPGASTHVTFEPLGGADGYLEASLVSTYI